MKTAFAALALMMFLLVSASAALMQDLPMAPVEANTTCQMSRNEVTPILRADPDKNSLKLGDVVKPFTPIAVVEVDYFTWAFGYTEGQWGWVRTNNFIHYKEELCDDLPDFTLPYMTGAIETVVHAEELKSSFNGLPKGLKNIRVIYRGYLCVGEECQLFEMQRGQLPVVCNDTAGECQMFSGAGCTAAALIDGYAAVIANNCTGASATPIPTNTPVPTAQPTAIPPTPLPPTAVPTIQPTVIAEVQPTVNPIFAQMPPEQTSCFIGKAYDGEGEAFRIVQNMRCLSESNQQWEFPWSEAHYLAAGIPVYEVLVPDNSETVGYTYIRIIEEFEGNQANCNVYRDSRYRFTVCPGAEEPPVYLQIEPKPGPESSKVDLFNQIVFDMGTYLADD